jgi:GntR family transcriptional regulator / MocR family aminotransferase
MHSRVGQVWPRKVVCGNIHLTAFRYDHYSLRMRRAAAAFSPLIAVSRKSARPLHRQIYDSFRSKIVGRTLSSGQPIPSTRALAAELGISRIPVLNAYAQLLAEGYFESRVGAGTFVSRSMPEHAAPSENLRAATSDAASGSRRVARASLLMPPYKREPWIRHHGAFSVSQPALDEFPFKAWANLVARHSRNPLVRGLEYGDPMGLRQLREVIAVYLRTSRAVRCEPKQIMIVSGSQQALDLSVRVLLNSGNPIWMEEPGYWLARHVLTAAGCRIVPVPVDTDGLDVSAGMKLCRNARAALVAPSHQYPLGVTMSASRRLQLLHWARQAGSWIIEDDYDSEYRFESKPIASLQGLDDTSRVIYIGTFSKVLFPSLRAGYLVIPADLVDHFLAMRHAMDVSPPHLFQAVLADFIAEGHFSRHIRRMRALYGERRAVLVESLAREFGSQLEVIGNMAGIHLAVTLPKGVDDVVIAKRAAEESLWLWPLSPTYAGKPSHHGFILGFGSTTSAEIPGAVRHMRTILATGEAA